MSITSPRSCLGRNSSYIHYERVRARDGHSGFALAAAARAAFGSLRRFTSGLGLDIAWMVRVRRLQPV